MFIGDIIKSIIYLSSQKDGIYRIQKYYKNRSKDQNSYLWGVVYQILSDETGNTVEEIHEYLKSVLLIDHTTKIPKIKSTTELTTKEFMDYIKDIQVWASTELNCYIPDPNEVPTE